MLKKEKCDKPAGNRRRLERETARVIGVNFSDQLCSPSYTWNYHLCTFTRQRVACCSRLLSPTISVSSLVQSSAVCI